jgi:hypothetical protein
LVHNYETKPSISEDACLTLGGPDPGVPCIFPYKFLVRTYNECAWQQAIDNKAWCSTQVDNKLRPVAGKWGHCGKGCPIPEDDRKNDNGNERHTAMLNEIEKEHNNRPYM